MKARTQLTFSFLCRAGPQPWNGAVVAIVSQGNQEILSQACQRLISQVNLDPVYWSHPLNEPTSSGLSAEYQILKTHCGWVESCYEQCGYPGNETHHLCTLLNGADKTSSSYLHPQ